MLQVPLYVVFLYNAAFAGPAQKPMTCGSVVKELITAVASFR